MIKRYVNRLCYGLSLLACFQFISIHAEKPSIQFVRSFGGKIAAAHPFEKGCYIGRGSELCWLSSATVTPEHLANLSGNIRFITSHHDVLAIITVDFGSSNANATFFRIKQSQLEQLTSVSLGMRDPQCVLMGRFLFINGQQGEEFKIDLEDSTFESQVLNEDFPSMPPGCDPEVANSLNARSRARLDVNDMAYEDGLLYVADAKQGLILLDPKDPESTVHTLDRTSTDASRICVDKNRIAMVKGKELVVRDLPDMTSLFQMNVPYTVEKMSWWNHEALILSGADEIPEDKSCNTIIIDLKTREKKGVDAGYVKDFVSSRPILYRLSSSVLSQVVSRREGLPVHDAICSQTLGTHIQLFDSSGTRVHALEKSSDSFALLSFLREPTTKLPSRVSIQTDAEIRKVISVQDTALLLLEDRTDMGDYYSIHLVDDAQYNDVVDSEADLHVNRPIACVAQGNTLYVADEMAGITVYNIMRNR